ncbi:MAG: PorT family protein [Bacteroidales bacterium]|nr:PorT family protein [Bacteroidales bacterium]
MKHNTIKSLCIAIVMLAMGINANAQFESSVYLNLGLPTAQFGGKADNSATAPLLTKDNIGTTATAGFGLGGRASYLFDVGFGEVAPFANIDFQWNQIKSTYRDAYATADANAKTPSYFNIPIFLGINYRYELTDVFKPFAEFGLGTDFFLISREQVNNSTLRYNVKNSFAWEIGAGCFFGRHVSAGIYYYGLGKHRITYNEKRTEINGLTVEQVNQAGQLIDPTFDCNKTQLRSIGELMLRIGFHF